jgi:hypothetical protein
MGRGDTQEKEAINTTSYVVPVLAVPEYWTRSAKTSLVDILPFFFFSVI